MNRYDVAIAGGGLAGSALALALARQGRTVAVIEAMARVTGGPPGFDDRTLALNAAALNILANLGVLSPSLARTDITRIRISRAGGFGRLDLRASEFGLERFGAVMVARELGRAMQSALDEADGLTLLCPARLATFDASDRHVDIRLEGGGALRAGLLVGADGTASHVRRHAGIACRRHDYGQHAMVFNALPAHADPGTAWERFTPSGPLALLPQPENRLGVVWIDHSASIEELAAAPDDALLARLAQRAGREHAGFTRIGRRGTYPLALCRAETHGARRVALIGNAATTVHPVSAQGFNLGLRDVAALAELAGAAADPGAPQVIEAYCRRRQPDQQATVRYTDTLARAFTNPSLPARLGAGLSLAFHAWSRPLQRRLVHAAMGFRPPVSALAHAPANPDRPAGKRA